MARLDAEDAELAEQQARSGAELKALRNVRGPERLTVELIRPETVVQAQHGGTARLALTSDPLSAHPFRVQHHGLQVRARSRQLDRLPAAAGCRADLLQEQDGHYLDGEPIAFDWYADKAECSAASPFIF
jgi:hypothetical protein